MQAEIIDFYMDLNRKNLDFDFDWDGKNSGGMGVAEMFVIPLFKGKICDTITDVVEDVVYMLNPILNNFLRN